MADVTPKVKIYVFLCIVVMMLNLTTVCISAVTTMNISSENDYFNIVDVKQIELDYSVYKSISNFEREQIITDIHGEKELVYYNGAPYYEFSVSKLTISVLEWEYYVRGALTQNELTDFLKKVNGVFKISELPYSEDSNYALLVGGVSATSFIPFASILITATQFSEIHPFDLLISFILILISSIQLYYLIVIVFNHLPFFNV